jgi:hypothetical protein
MPLIDHEPGREVVIGFSPNATAWIAEPWVTVYGLGWPGLPVVSV